MIKVKSLYVALERGKIALYKELLWQIAQTIEKALTINGLYVIMTKRKKAG